MKILIFAALAFIGPMASAASVSSCKGDSHTLEKIGKLDPQSTIVLMDSDNEMVGALEYYLSNSSKQFSALYLCGRNDGYYYVDNANIADWIGSVGTSKTIGSIYNDETSVMATSTTLYIGSQSAKVEINITAPFKASFFADLPTK